MLYIKISFHLTILDVRCTAIYLHHVSWGCWQVGSHWLMVHNTFKGVITFAYKNIFPQGPGFVEKSIGWRPQISLWLHEVIFFQQVICDCRIYLYFIFLLSSGPFGSQKQFIVLQFCQKVWFYSWWCPRNVLWLFPSPKSDHRSKSEPSSMVWRTVNSLQKLRQSFPWSNFNTLDEYLFPNEKIAVKFFFIKAKFYLANLQVRNWLTQLLGFSLQ